MSKELDEALARYDQRMSPTERAADNQARVQAEAQRAAAKAQKASIVGEVHAAMAAAKDAVGGKIASRFESRPDGYAVYILNREGRDSLDHTLFINVDELANVRVTTMGKGASMSDLGQIDAGGFTPAWLHQRVAQWIDTLTA